MWWGVGANIVNSPITTCNHKHMSRSHAMPCSLNPSHSVFQNIQNLALLLSLYNRAKPNQMFHVPPCYRHHASSWSDPFNAGNASQKTPSLYVIATDQPRTLDSRHSQNAPSVIDTGPRVPN